MNNNPIKQEININYDLFSEEDFIKDCPNYPLLPTILPKVPRVIAIGDIHGDYDLMIRSFKIAKLIDDQFNWIANPSNTIVVQVGDQIDSCRPIPGVHDCQNKLYPNDKPNDIKILEFFNQIHRKAMVAGGAVYSLLGNHELMNSQQKFRYVSYKNLHDFHFLDSNNQLYRGSEGRTIAFQPGGPVAKMMACTRSSVIIIGNTMFTHAGILPKLVKHLDHINIDQREKLKYLNAIIRKWLLNKLSNDSDAKNIIENNDLSPFWTRIYGSIPKNMALDSDQCFHYVKNTLQVFKIGQIVVGHTPQKKSDRDGINGTCYQVNGDNKLYRVDGGFSQAFQMFYGHNRAQVLEIINDTEFNIITEE